MNDIKGSYYVVDYQHIDDHRCFRPLDEHIEQSPFADQSPPNYGKKWNSFVPSSPYSLEMLVGKAMAL